MTKFLERLARGDGAIDVGANVGSVTRQMAKHVGPQGHVLALEPNPSAAAECLKACAKFPWVSVRQTAVIDRGGEVPMYLGAQTVHGSIAEKNVIAMKGKIHVSCDTLDHLSESVPRLSAIKIDAQGAEGHILAGAHRLLRTKGISWMVEIWPAGLLACGATVSDLCHTFAKHGLSVVASGKTLDEPGMSWETLDADASTWRGHKNTNVLIGRLS